MTNRTDKPKYVGKYIGQTARQTVVACKTCCYKDKDGNFGRRKIYSEQAVFWTWSGSDWLEPKQDVVKQAQTLEQYLAAGGKITKL